MVTEEKERREERSSYQRNGRRRADAHRREIERQVRIFLDYAKRHPNHLFASGTQNFLDHVRPIIEQMDAIEAAARQPKK